MFASCRADWSHPFAIAIALAVLPLPLPLAAQQDLVLDSIHTANIDWRGIGPFRGGRSVAVAGVVSDRMTYYFGGVGGGVYKTTDAGVTWRNVTDGWLNTGSVGALAVSESDPNVVYVGMGEHAVRGVATSFGDGMYRSTDAGRSWTHLGLERTRAISRIRVHPANPDLVYVAAQGGVHGESDDRGIYRSRDGGRTWEKVLFVSRAAGASDLAMDMTNPRILYAAFWDHIRLPWQVRSGGPGSGIWKSTDGGDTWTRLTKGLPALMGKIGVDVSRADPDRVFANVEAEQGGLYRSDDAGETWQRVNSTREIQTRSWYYMEVYADPQDRETVYVLNAPMLRSVDGGRTFTNVAVPHGDNHDLWIHPHDNRVMINANDGGANVSFNAGASWSTQQNQPTAQFYRVITDNRFPYHVYGGQQDNSSVAIASAAPGGIGWKDWAPMAGCESAYLAFDPDNPVKVFGGCYQGLIEVWDARTRESKPIMAYPFLGLAVEPKDQKYRFNWNAPIVASPHDPNLIYHAGNVVLRTTDGGQSWQEMSPDLTRDEEAKQGLGGTPITNEGAGGETYNTIATLVESPHERGVIWVGTDDGLIQLTRDGGATWRNVTPPNVGEALVNSIEVSPHDPATAYVAITRYRFDDFTPHIFRTTDYGQRWTRLVEGIHPEAFVRVVREDPVRRGLLFAGTERGLYISFDAGAHWRQWQRNLPVVPINDLTIRNGDLVAATSGRSFWILDDLSPLRQLSADVLAKPMHVFAPRPAVRVNWGGGGPGGGSATDGSNPPAGAQVFVMFAQKPDTLVTMQILDASGAVIRTLATNPEAAGRESYTRLDTLEAGLNRLAWDFRREGVTRVPELFVYGSLNGPLVPPGRYQVRVTWRNESQTVPLELLPDPRLDVAAADWAAQDRLLQDALGTVDSVHVAVTELRGAREQIAQIAENARDHVRGDTVRTVADTLRKRIDGWEQTVVQPQQKTFQDVINFANRLNAQILALIAAIDGGPPPLTQGSTTRFADLQAEWAERKVALNAILADIEAFNALVRDVGLPPVIVKRTPRRVIS